MSCLMVTRNELFINEEITINGYKDLGYESLSQRYYGNQLDRISRIS